MTDHYGIPTVTGWGQEEIQEEQEPSEEIIPKGKWLCHMCLRCLLEWELRSSHWTQLLKQSLFPNPTPVLSDPCSKIWLGAGSTSMAWDYLQMVNLKTDGSSGSACLRLRPELCYPLRSSPFMSSNPSHNFTHDPFSSILETPVSLSVPLLTPLPNPALFIRPSSFCSTKLGTDAMI